MVRQMDDLAEIDILPEGRINPGDILLVDYRFLRPPLLKNSTLAWRYNVGLDYRWLSLFYTFERSDQSLLTGQDTAFLEDVTRQTAGVQLRWDGPNYRASLQNEYRKQDSTRLSFDALNFSQSLSYQLSADAALTLSGNESLLFLQDRTTANYQARANLTWRIGPTLSASGSLSARFLRDSVAVDEDAYEAEIRGTWFFRRLEVSPSLGYRETDRGGTRLREYRATLSTIRRF